MPTLSHAEQERIVRAACAPFTPAFPNERGDLLQEGWVALLAALPLYDPGAGVPLKAYLAQRVRWHVMHLCDRRRQRRAGGLPASLESRELRPDQQAMLNEEVARRREQQP